jgi:hypothetical protein
VSQSARGVRLADAGQTEGEHIRGPIEEVAARQLVKLLDQRPRQSGITERVERFTRWKLRSSQEPLDAALSSISGFELENLQQERQPFVLASNGDIMDPLSLLCRLATAVPPPRFIR